MALFRRASSEPPAASTDPIEPDPAAYVPTPPPAPYKPAVYGPAPIAPGRTDIEKGWPNDIGNEPDRPLPLRRKYAADTEYIRENHAAEIDPIGYYAPPDKVKAVQAPDPRWAGVDPTIGKSAPRLPEKYSYFREFQQAVSRTFGEPVDRSEEGVPMTPVRQGNFGIREWRLTSRLDPTSGETYDRSGVSNRALVNQYNATSTVRRDLRL